MARRKSIPSYCHHKPSGQAVSYIDRKAVYLGPHESPESRQAYAALLSRLAAESLADKSKTTTNGRSVSVATLCLKFVTDELARFSIPEQHCQKTAIRLLRQLFGEALVSEFGPLRLRVVRQAMVDGDPKAKNSKGELDPRKPWSRQTVNRQVKRIQALFRWGVSWEMVPEEIARSLSTVRILMAGETTAAESVPRRSVCQEDIEAVRKELKPRHRDILDLLCLTGARPGELIGLKMKDINRTGDIWRADLSKHKTSHKGKSRTLFFNVTAQAILLRHFKADPEARIFPCRRDNFGAAVRRACDRAKIVPFVPHEIRHTTATRLVDQVGLESTQRLLGHSEQSMTEHYSRTADKQAIEAVKKLG
jgi:integrase